jgi:arylsulfatase A-like enzyme/Tfp pilus assembly protein PilF
VGIVKYVLLSLLLFLSCAGADRRPNVLLVTLDTTRSDYISCLGGTKAHTPHIDSAAERGVLFTRAFSTVPLTLPAHATIMTGLYPPGHGVRNNGSYRLGETIPTLAVTLARAGYSTGAVVGSVVLDSQFGLDAGFAHYDDAMPEAAARRPGASSSERNAAEVTRAALSFLESDPGSPFFLWVHYFDPHDPYTPPPPFDRAYASDPYAGEIAYMDSHIGTLLERVGPGESDRPTLIVIAGDHGEDLGDHGEGSHGVFLYESTMRIPLVMSLPGSLPEGAIYGHPVSIADIFPTILGLLGIESAGPAPQGRSLAGLLEADRGNERALYIETRYPLESMSWSPLEGLILGEWKYIRAPQSELYNLPSDPKEATNLIDREAQRAHAMAALLDSLEASLPLQEAEQAKYEAGEETLEKLRSLGYIDAPAHDSAVLKDPKDMVPLLALREKGLIHYHRGDYAGAESVFREALEIDPTNLFILNHLGLALSRAGRMREAIDVWEKTVRMSPGYVDVLINLAGAYFANGDARSALSAYEKILATNPRLVGALVGKARALLATGEYGAAIEPLELVRAERPDYAEGHLLLGRCYRQTGRKDEAREQYAVFLSLWKGDERMRRTAQEELESLNSE